MKDNSAEGRTTRRKEGQLGGGKDNSAGGEGMLGTTQGPGKTRGPAWGDDVGQL